MMKLIYYAGALRVAYMHVQSVSSGTCNILIEGEDIRK